SKMPDSRVSDQHVELSPFLYHGIHRLLLGGEIADIRGDAQGATSTHLVKPCRSLVRSTLRPACDGNIHSLAQQHLCYTIADTFGATGYQHRSVFNVSHGQKILVSTR